MSFMDSSVINAAIAMNPPRNPRRSVPQTVLCANENIYRRA
jgi:hypothetical protein